MVTISDAVTYPMESENWLTTVVIGGILVLLGFLLIPLFLAYGYIVRAIRERLAGASEPPTFGDWGTLFVEGLQAWIIGLIYMIIPVLVGAVTVGGAITAMATGTEAGVAAGLGGMFVGFAVTFVLALLFGYVAVAAVVNFAREERFGAAFDFGVLKGIVLHRDYAVAWVLSIVVFFVASLVNAIPLIGWILAPFVGFYAAIVATDLWSDGVSEALDLHRTASTPSEDPIV